MQRSLLMDYKGHIGDALSSQNALGYDAQIQLYEATGGLIVAKYQVLCLSLEIFDFVYLYRPYFLQHMHIINLFYILHCCNLHNQMEAFIKNLKIVMYVIFFPSYFLHFIVHFLHHDRY